MRLAKAEIKNFRAIQKLEVNFDQETVFIGANGVGKSCVLKALDRFFSPSAAIFIEDFHDRNTADPIDVALTFVDFSDEEADVFASKIFNNRMVVLRRFLANASSRDNGKYFGQSLRHPPFQNIRAIEGALARRQALNTLAGSDGYEDLKQAANAAEFDENLASWEANHTDQCVLSIDDG